MKNKQKLRNPSNEEGLKQAKEMTKRLDAKEIAALTVSFISSISIVTDFEPLATSIRDIIHGDPDWLKFGFALGGLIFAVVLCIVSAFYFLKDKKSFEEKSKIYFYADTKCYLDVIAKIRKIDQDNKQLNDLEPEGSNYLPYSDKLVTVEYKCDSNIPFSEDWYFYNPNVNKFLQSKECLDSLICVFSNYQYKIPNICKRYVPFILFKEIYGESNFFDGKKLRLCSEFDFALPRSPQKLENDKLLHENGTRIYGDRYKDLERKNVLYFNATSQFNTKCTNDIAFKKIRSIERVDEEFVGSELFIEHERVVSEKNGKYIDEKIDKFIGYGESAMSNQVGCSALLITKDSKIVIRRQNKDAGSYSLMLVPSGSTSVSFAAYDAKKCEKNSAHTVFIDDDEAKNNEKYKDYIARGQHIVDLKATLDKCVKNDLRTKFGIDINYSKIIGFLKVVFRGNLPDFSCLAYVDKDSSVVFKEASDNWKSKEISRRKKALSLDHKPTEDEETAITEEVNSVDTTRVFKIFDLKHSEEKPNELLPDGGLLDRFTLQADKVEDRTNDSISIQLHAILTFLKDNPTLLKEFIDEAKKVAEEQEKVKKQNEQNL
mgnify:CR=1 FL=1